MFSSIAFLNFQRISLPIAFSGTLSLYFPSCLCYFYFIFSKFLYLFSSNSSCYLMHRAFGCWENAVAEKKNFQFSFIETWENWTFHLAAPSIKMFGVVDVRFGTRATKKTWIFPLIEGKYEFSWMKSWANWQQLYIELGFVKMACGFVGLVFLLFGLGNKFIVFGIDSLVHDRVFVPEAWASSGGWLSVLNLISSRGKDLEAKKLRGNFCSVGYSGLCGCFRISHKWKHYVFLFIVFWCNPFQMGVIRKKRENFFLASKFPTNGLGYIIRNYEFGMGSDCRSFLIYLYACKLYFIHRNKLLCLDPNMNMHIQGGELG